MSAGFNEENSCKWRSRVVNNLCLCDEKPKRGKFLVKSNGLKNIFIIYENELR